MFLPQLLALNELPLNGNVFTSLSYLWMKESEAETAIRVHLGLRNG
jgi:hypothetical protein